MSYVKSPPPSVEHMIDQFADWMAQHANAKITVRIEYSDGMTCDSITDRRQNTRTKKVENDNH